MAPMKRYTPVKKSLVLAKNGKGAVISLDIPLYDAIVEKFEVIEAMEKDPIVAEVRKNRAKLVKRFQGDVRAIVKDAQKRQQLSKRQLVSFAKGSK
jgi:hypothetical protein